MGYKIIHFDGTEKEVNEQWLEYRKGGIGGSDAATVLGLNNYATPYTLWLEKTGRTEAPDLSDNEKVYWGNVLEDIIRLEFAMRHPEMIVRESFDVYVSDDNPFMFASVDAMIYDGSNVAKPGWVTEKDAVAVLEIKTCGERRRSDWDDGVPSYYLAQVMHYLAVTGLTTAYVAVLIGGQEYREYKIERDDEDIAHLIDKEREFWSMVQTDTMPPFVGSSIDNAALMEQHPKSDGEMLAGLDMDVPIAKLADIKDKINELEKEKKAIEAELRSMIGDAKGIETPTYKCTWTRTTVDRFDTKAFKADNSELYEKYTESVPRDMGLRVSKKK